MARFNLPIGTTNDNSSVGRCQELAASPSTKNGGCDFPSYDDKDPGNDGDRDFPSSNDEDSDLPSYDDFPSYNDFPSYHDDEYYIARREKREECMRMSEEDFEKWVESTIEDVKKLSLKMKNHDTGFDARFGKFLEKPIKSTAANGGSKNQKP